MECLFKRKTKIQGDDMLRDLQFFSRLCQEKSIRKAAEALFITQQGLSKAMKSLETELGVQLFTRSNEGIVLTKAGKIVAKRSKNILNEFSDMKLELREYSATVPNQLRIAFASGVINALQTDFLYDFQNRYPEIDITVGEHPDIPCEEAVTDNEADLGFAIGPVDKRKFSFFKVREGHITVVVNRCGPFAGERSVRLQDLAKEKWVVPNAKFKSYHNIASKCAALGVKPKIGMLAADIRMIHKFCHLNNGVGFVCDSEARDSRFENVANITLNRDSRIEWDIYLVTRKIATLSPAAKNFIEHVKKWYKIG